MTADKIFIVPPKGIPLQMVVTFIEKSRAGLPALWTALGESEFDVLRVSGHRMKGTGAAYGFPPLTTIGAAIEKAAASRNLGEVRSQIETLETYLSRVEVAAA